MIPRRLVRTVPQRIDFDTERLWKIAKDMHPDWEHVTWRDPINPHAFPISSPYWGECESGAQLADLIRVEDLLHNGGWYIDSDMWMLQPLDDLCGLNAVAAWEDHLYIPNAVLGFTPGHPALEQILKLAIDRRGQGTWKAGVAVCTEVLRNRSDVVLLPPQVFYPVDWRTAHRKMVDWSAIRKANPWSYGIHKYQASWHASLGP